jgi:dihydroxy-acid dehydratase
VEEGDLIRIDIPARRIDVLVDSATLDKRRAAVEARGADAWRPNRDRKITDALRAYAHMTTSAARGAVRDLAQLDAGRRSSRR